MEELKTILLAHARRYPAMDCTDAVKLLYQNEFGGGHLISDEEACLRYLQAEYEAQTQSGQEPLWEDIGNGYVRVNLRALDAHGYAVCDLGQDFLRSARIPSGSLPSFLKKLEVLQELTGEGLLPFTPEALREYLADYAQRGYPMVSHSPRYRAHYRPAYRVVRRDCFPF